MALIDDIEKQIDQQRQFVSDDNYIRFEFEDELVQQIGISKGKFHHIKQALKTENNEFAESHILNEIKIVSRYVFLQSKRDMRGADFQREKQLKEATTTSSSFKKYL